MEILNVSTNFNYKLIGLLMAGLFSFGIFGGFVVFPKIIEWVITKNIRLSPDSDARSMYLRPPFPIEFKVYFFNVTNPEDVEKGSKPIVQEVGPYVFDEWKEKIDPVDDDPIDGLEFTLINKFIFRPDLTLPLTGDELITIPHLVILGGMIKVKREREEMLSFVTAGMDLIFNNPKSAFLTAKAWDILYDGISINCAQTEFTAKVICSALSGGELKDAVEVVNKTELRISMFKQKNGTDAGHFEVFRGMHDVTRVGEVIEYNGDIELDEYDEAECNKWKGTDGLMFPPFMEREKPIWAFAPELCRSFAIKYEADSIYEGVDTARFVLEIPEHGNNQAPVCFCREPDLCPPKGTFDLDTCMKAPIIASKPHFLGGDVQLFKNIDGMNPSKDKHETFGDFHLLTGTPLHVARRLQFSIDMEPVPEYEILKHLPKAVLPMFWIEEKLSMNQTFVDDIQTLNFFQRLNKIFTWFSISIGLIGFALCTVFLIKNRNGNMNVAKGKNDIKIVM